jgi:hypothetical protein
MRCLRRLSEATGVGDTRHPQEPLSGNHAYLSDVLKLIAKQHTPTRVHWLACRNAYPNASRQFYAQPSGTFGPFGGYDNVDLSEDTIRKALEEQRQVA